MKDVIDQITKNKGRVVFVSPHLDDAIFSCGGLISELKNKTDVKIINVFTTGDTPLTLSAKKFLEQCGYKSQEELYKDRVEEDKNVFKTLKLNPVNIGLKDALFRKKENPNILEKTLGKILPEFLHIYPIYRLNIVKGNISKKDGGTFLKIQNEIEKLNLGKNDYLFAPYGIGGHVDHRIVSKVAKTFVNVTNVILWGDYPYITKSTKSLNNFISFKPNWFLKEKLFKGYKSQYKAVFGTRSKKIGEYYFVSKVRAYQSPNFLELLKLFLIKPKDFIYVCLLPKNTKVKIFDFDIKVKKAGIKLKKSLEAELPSSKVYFIGSSALNLPGQKDIDILIEADKSKFDIYIRKINKILETNPSKTRTYTIQWFYKIKDTDIDVTLFDNRDRRIQNLISHFNVLNKNKSLQNEYRNLKYSSLNSSIRDYEFKKLKFFNKQTL